MANNELKSLDNIFDGKFLRIPDYQRGYAWQEQQYKEFWEDIENLEDKHIHYTGVLTLEKVTQSKKEEKIESWKKDIGAFDSENSYYIVDGQQRITTCIILISVILGKVNKEQWFVGKKLSKLNDKYIGEENQHGVHLYYFGYTTDNPSYEFLKTSIFNNQSSSNKDEETLYTANLENAKLYFKEKIKDLTINQLENIFKKLTQYFKFNVYEISDDLDVFVAFETMNNRGKQLSNLELLKNRLIYLSTKIKAEDISLRDDINNCWKTIYEYLGKNKENLLDDDKFLKNHWIMYHDYSRKKGNDYIVDLLEERYTAKNVIQNKITIKEIRDYTLSLQESVKHWYYLHNPEKAQYNPTIKLWLDKLYRLNYGAFTPLLMAIFSRDSNYDCANVVKLLKTMEQYIFLIFKISQRRANTGDSEFYSYAREYYSKDKKIKDIIGVKNTEHDKDTGITWWKEEYFDLSQFQNYLNEKFSKREGYYSWNGINYFLFEYELSLKLKSKNSEDKINWMDYSNRKTDYITIEHVMPQTINDKCWEQEVNKLSEKKIKNVCNTLGNLVPLSRGKNSKLQNYCFNIKKNGKFEEDMIGYKNGSYSEQEINEKPNWSIDEIKSRGKKLLGFMSENWDIEELKDENTKEVYLFMENK